MANVTIPQNKMLNLGKPGCSTDRWISNRTLISALPVVKPAVSAEAIRSTWRPRQRPAVTAVYKLDVHRKRAQQADHKGF